MPNDLAGEVTKEAAHNFDQIDTKHTGNLNLVDIMAYEQKGPEQKRVGQFLQDNYDRIRGISSLSTPDRASDSPHGMITRNDLNLVNLLSGRDQSEIKRKESTDAIESGLVAGMSAAGFALLPAMAATGISSFEIGPAAPLIGIGIETGAAVGGYMLGSKMVMDDYKKKESDVGKMRL